VEHVERQEERERELSGELDELDDRGDKLENEGDRLDDKVDAVREEFQRRKDSPEVPGAQDPDSHPIEELEGQATGNPPNDDAPASDDDDS
jgi:predicted nuclease with TOPRIM domain